MYTREMKRIKWVFVIWHIAWKCPALSRWLLIWIWFGVKNKSTLEFVFISGTWTWPIELWLRFELLYFGQKYHDDIFPFVSLTIPANPVPKFHLVSNIIDIFSIQIHIWWILIFAKINSPWFNLEIDSEMSFASQKLHNWQ